MFDTLTPATIITAATPFGAELVVPLGIVVGLGVAFAVANWIAARAGRR